MKPVSLLLGAVLSGSLYAQSPLIQSQKRAVVDPATPAARDVRVKLDRLQFHLPPGWNVSLHDGEFSTFALDARSALGTTELRAAADIDFNPYPYSTFSGALFYVSSTPKSTVKSCANQASAPELHRSPDLLVGGFMFKHGYTEHGGSCIESRDEVYTAMRGTSCLRFDLVINTFCGGEVSGVRDMSQTELQAMRQRLEGILASVKFDSTSAPVQRTTSTEKDHGKGEATTQ